MENLGGRKFFMAVILVLLATIFVFMDKASFTEWATFSGAILGLYGTGNVWTKFLENRPNGSV